MISSSGIQVFLHLRTPPPTTTPSLRTNPFILTNFRGILKALLIISEENASPIVLHLRGPHPPFPPRPWVSPMSVLTSKALEWALRTPSRFPIANNYYVRGSLTEISLDLYYQAMNQISPHFSPCGASPPSVWLRYWPERQVECRLFSEKWSRISSIIIYFFFFLLKTGQLWLRFGESWVCRWEISHHSQFLTLSLCFDLPPLAVECVDFPWGRGMTV